MNKFFGLSLLLMGWFALQYKGNIYLLSTTVLNTPLIFFFLFSFCKFIIYDSLIHVLIWK